MKAPLDNTELLSRACKYNKETAMYSFDQQMMLMMLVSMINDGEFDFNALDTDHRQIVIAFVDTYNHVQQTSTNDGEKQAWHKLRHDFIQNERTAQSVHYYIENTPDTTSASPFVTAYKSLLNRSLQGKPISPFSKKSTLTL